MQGQGFHQMVILRLSLDNDYWQNEPYNKNSQKYAHRHKHFCQKEERHKYATVNNSVVRAKSPISSKVNYAQSSRLSLYQDAHRPKPIWLQWWCY